MRILAFVIPFVLTSTLNCAEEQWEIITGCSGGVTGGGSGYIVSSQGDLFKWRSSTPENLTKEHVSQLPRQTVVEWKSRFEHVRLGELRYKKVGNMTCSLALRTNEDERVVRWPISGPFPPDEVMHVFNEIEALGKAGSQKK